MIIRLLILLFCTLVFLDAKSGKEIAKELKLNPASKAIIQWERMFKSPKRLERIGAENLSDEEKSELKKFLVKYAADSDQPAAAGL
ncbi:MAG: hypothetical protein ACLFQJ_06625 [Campylobacterales bacterium]